MKTQTLEQEFLVHKFKHQLRTVHKYLVEQLIEKHCQGVHVPVFMNITLIEQQATEELNRLLETGKLKTMYDKICYYENE